MAAEAEVESQQAMVQKLHHGSRPEEIAAKRGLPIEIVPGAVAVAHAAPANARQIEEVPADSVAVDGTLLIT